MQMVLVCAAPPSVMLMLLRWFAAALILLQAYALLRGRQQALFACNTLPGFGRFKSWIFLLCAPLRLHVEAAVKCWVGFRHCNVLKQATNTQSI
jgi:hypothetical protein